MRRVSPAGSSSYGSEPKGSDADDYVESDADLTDVVTSADDDEENGASLPLLKNHPPEYYLRLLEDFDEGEYTKQDYSDGTTRLIDRMQDLWNECWTDPKLEHLRDFATVSVQSLYVFLDWLLSRRESKEDKEGRKRRLRGTKFASSLETYWKVFRLVYERATNLKLDGKLNRTMRRVLQKLVKEHKLRTIGRDKACMYVEDLNLVLETNLRTVEKKYSHGRYRIQAQLYLQLGGFTANRPGALLSLCYRHIQVTLLRDPEGGPHRILLEFTFEFTKQFLGIKDMNKFPFPEITFDETLAFSPHIFLLGLLFHDRAFAAYNLTSPEDINKLQIPSGHYELPLRLDESLGDIPVFRKVVRTTDGWAISRNEPLPYQTLLNCIKTLGQITGFAEVARPYSLRYAGGKAFNQDGNVSEAMQNLMMGHASIGTFLKHYLSRRVTVDTQAVIRGIKPQDVLMRAACTMSRSIDRRRPRRLTSEQSESVNDHPTIITLCKRRTRMKRTLPNATKDLKYQLLNRQINQERQRQRRALLQDIKRRWEYEQPVRDVERQLAGDQIEDDPEASSDTMLPIQKELAESVLSQPGTSIEEEFCRRNRAIRAVTLYCGIEEGGMKPLETKRGHQLTHPRAETLSEKASEALEEAKVKVYKEPRPRICFLCLGNENLPVDERTYEFYSSGDLTRHFKRKHLQYVGSVEFLECKLCQVALEDKMHLQRHALEIHGTVSPAPLNRSVY